MGKKTKVGKSRRDKFYQLAKETGYRSRAAFKLLQLNRKYEFLQKSRVCLDLCAAPGGWLQVAAHHMPVSSVIIGVDLVAIKPIPNVVTFQEDITTDKCRQTLKKELQTWKADVVLHDGAPNVGMNWLHDAFQQAQLTLQALKLATEFLRKGGWFVTKVFRSKDYNSLLWVFHQLFKKVYATKPLASRTESAEIFVVCQHYLAPDKLDPKFLNPQFVFKDVGEESKTPLNLIHPEKTTKKAEGYDDDAHVLFTKVMATEYLKADNHLELLANCNQIVIDDDAILNDPVTTDDIKESCKDIKVLGKRELRQLMKWRQKMKEKLQKNSATESHAEGEGHIEGHKSDENEEEDEEGLDEEIRQITEEKRKDLKKKRKKVMKEKRKLRDRMNLNMVIPGDRIDTTDDIDLFNLSKIKTKQGLEQMETEDAEVESDDDSLEDELDSKNKRRPSVPYKQRSTAVSCNDNFEETESEDDDDDSNNDDSAEPSEDDMETDDTHGMIDTLTQVKDKNPLVVDLESQSDAVRRRTDMWFSKDIFKDMNDEDEASDVDSDAPEIKKTKTASDAKKTQKLANDDADSDSDYDINQLVSSAADQTCSKKKEKINASKDGFEIVKADEPAKKFVKLSPAELAIGEEIIKSSKRRREILEMSYHRYTFGDEELPSWFVSDESKHCRKQLPVTKEQIAYYKERLKAIDARPIKKIAEAKARKKRKMTKRLEKARKKADLVSENLDVSDREKWKQIKDIYKKAGLLKKQQKEITYVVAKKGVGRRVSRPAGVKGHFKVVDPRMKKDNRKQKSSDKNKSRKTSKNRSAKRTK